MASLDAKTIVELLVGVILTLATGWLAAEKSALKDALRTGLQNVRKDLTTQREILEAKIDGEVKAREGLEAFLKSWCERLEQKIDRALERK